jgi:hypothetical protein
MAESVKPTAIEFNWDNAVKRLKELEDYALTFKGKAKHNPFIYIRNVIEPLRNGPKDKASYDKVMALKETAPTV